MQIRKISLIAPSLYQEKICDSFSIESSADQRKYYEKKGEGNLSKLRAWAYSGKMAEYSVFNTLLSYNKYEVVTPPDIAIYKTKRKSHAADIQADDKKVHIKSCMLVDGRQSSWLFSTEDPIVNNPQEYDMVALVIISDTKEFMAYFIPAKDLLGKYKKPNNPTTIAHAIYEDDLITSS